MNGLIKALAATLIVIAIALAAFAWTLSRRDAGQAVAAAGSAPAVPQYPMLVLSQPVQAGVALTAEMLRTEQVGFAIGGGFTRPDEVLGRRVAVDLAAGTPVVESQLMSGLATKVAEGERAVAVRVDEHIGIGHRVRPGDLVDVFVTLKREGQELVDSESRLLISRLRVLGYGEASVDGPANPPASAPEGSERAAARNARADQPKSAVLAVPVEQVATLVLGQQTGSLTLALRNPDDALLPEAKPLTEPAPALPLAAASGPRSPSDLALAGMSLSGLAGELPIDKRPEARRGGNAATPYSAATARRAAATPGAEPRGGKAAGSDTVEVIRSGQREQVNY